MYLAVPLARADRIQPVSSPLYTWKDKILVLSISLGTCGHRHIVFLFESFWIFWFPAALDGTLWNKLTLVFYEFMKKKRELLAPEFAQVGRLVFFHTYKMHFYLLITIWYALKFKLSVKFMRHAFHLWFLLIFYDDVYRWQISPPWLVSRQIILNVYFSFISIKKVHKA